MAKSRKSRSGHQTTARALAAYKRRLGGVLRLIGGSGATRDVITARLNTAACKVSRSTVSRWMDPAAKPVPDSFQLMVISRLARDISLDWLVAGDPAESLTEQFVETSGRGRKDGRGRRQTAR